MAAASLNVQMRDAALAHLIDLHRFSNGQVRGMLAAMSKADVKLFDRLAIALARMPTSEFNVARLQTLLAGVWSANEATYRQLSLRTAADMRELTTIELQYQHNTFTDLLPEAALVNLATPTADAVWAATEARPLQGRLMSEWFDSLASNRQQRISDTLRMGYVSGDTVETMVGALRGTRASGYTDGLLSIDSRNAESVVRTFVSGTAATAREAFYAENADLIEAEQWVSTLDSRTTEECQIRDGLLYSVDDHEPLDSNVPWDEGPGELHFNCRSVSVPVLSSAKSLGLDLPAPERAAMDGTAAPGTTFGDWIADQPPSVQDAALGATKGELLRAGTPFSKFFSGDGTPLSIHELRAKL